MPKLGNPQQDNLAKIISETICLTRHWSQLRILAKLAARFVIAWASTLPLRRPIRTSSKTALLLSFYPAQPLEVIRLASWNLSKPLAPEPIFAPAKSNSPLKLLMQTLRSVTDE